MTTSPLDLTLLQLRDAILARTLSAEDATKAALTSAESLQTRLNATTELFPEQALAQARAIDQRLAAHEHFGPHSGLAGVPVILKDNICLAWGKTTCASRILENYRSPYTATAAQRLIDSGAIIIGKANLDEFAMGSATEHSAFGPTFNPWDTARVPGGSSGGSAASVSASIVPGALGSDTGGSIRQPAGMCNVVGLKPTYGRVSRYGLVAYASSLDQIGPFARTVADAGLLTSIISGHDPLDSTSLDQPAPDLLTDLEKPVSRLTIGIPTQARSTANHPAVAAALESAAKTYADMGATIVDVDLKHAEHGIAAYYIIALAEASSNLARFDGVRYGRRAKLGTQDSLLDLYARSRAEGFGAEVQRRIMLGTHVLSSGYYDAYYTTAQKVRRLIKSDFDSAFAAGGPHGCHAILMPSSPNPAWRIGEKTGDPLAEYLEDVYTVGVNLAGLPALSMPGGFASVDGHDLPIGLQLIGAPSDESTLLRIARMFEQATNFGTRRPPL